MLRTERDEANAPAIATNYASTELNLKDRRARCTEEKEKAGEGGKGAIRVDRKT